ncbi:MAG: hypothetical protein CMI96_02400 [Pelagibacteraceae bacterium]|nr:hypothetical protein [Pelagibacteraceae bacterium]|tara:strand:+ start:12701 stop:12904 length:204 start_codon:yes stop_codon:yes gene_type:complete
MKILNRLKALKINIAELQKLNQELIEKNYANSIKINKLENKINMLRNGIQQTIEEIEQYKNQENVKS